MGKRLRISSEPFSFVLFDLPRGADRERPSAGGCKCELLAVGPVRQVQYSEVNVEVVTLVTPEIISAAHVVRRESRFRAGAAALIDRAKWRNAMLSSNDPRIIIEEVRFRVICPANADVGPKRADRIERHMVLRVLTM